MGRTALIAATLIVYGLLTTGWTLAWMLKQHLDAEQGWLATGSGSFLYWTAAKLLLWILPALWLIRQSGRGPGEVLNLTNWRGWLAWGGGIGILIALSAIVPNYLSGRPLLAAEFSLPLVNALAIAPVFEEFLMRGAILGNLEKACEFWIANVASALMFLGLHLPGWYFMGSLAANFSSPTGGALSIFVLGLAFGFAVRRSRSVMGGVLAHFLNNLASSR
jgi:membrane protease YdiL (CAAX protease family)